MGLTKQFYTDNNGIAYVEHASSEIANIYLNGSNLGTLRAPGSDAFSIRYQELKVPNKGLFPYYATFRARKGKRTSKACALQGYIRQSFYG